MFRLRLETTPWREDTLVLKENACSFRDVIEVASLAIVELEAS